MDFKLNVKFSFFIFFFGIIFVLEIRKFKTQKEMKKDCELMQIEIRKRGEKEELWD